jgi:plastocyanin
VLTVEPDTVITFVNVDATAHLEWHSRSFDSGDLPPGARANVKLVFPGTYSFSDVFHPGLTGSIVVRPDHIIQRCSAAAGCLDMVE